MPIVNEVDYVNIIIIFLETVLLKTGKISHRFCKRFVMFTLSRSWHINEAVFNVYLGALSIEGGLQLMVIKRVSNNMFKIVSRWHE